MANSSLPAHQGDGCGCSLSNEASKYRPAKCHELCTYAARGEPLEQCYQQINALFIFKASRTKRKGVVQVRDHHATQYGTDGAMTIQVSI